MTIAGLVVAGLSETRWISQRDRPEPSYRIRTPNRRDRTNVLPGLYHPLTPMVRPTIVGSLASTHMPAPSYQATQLFGRFEESPNSDDVPDPST
jgi:hypothetical protein